MAHSPLVTDAAEEIARKVQESTGQATEAIHQMTKDAGRRVAEALGEVFWVISDITGICESNTMSAVNATPASVVSENTMTPL